MDFEELTGTFGHYMSSSQLVFCVFNDGKNAHFVEELVSSGVSSRILSSGNVETQNIQMALIDRILTRENNKSVVQ